MYLEFFEFKHKPFTIKSDSSVLYMNQQYTSAFSLLQYGIENCDGFTVITGEVGCGKTTLCNTLIRDLQDHEYNIISFTIPPKSEEELLTSICMKLEITLAKSDVSLEKLRNKILAKLRKDQERGSRTVMFIDEAQNLSIDNLETVRLLSNLDDKDEKLLHIILIGQPELKKTLQLKCMRQLRQRISVFHDLQPLNYHDMKNYIAHRIAHAKKDNGKDTTWRKVPLPHFSFFALRKIYSASKGIPRIINNICDKALISAFIDYSQKIRLRDVLRAIKEMKKIKAV